MSSVGGATIPSFNVFCGSFSSLNWSNSIHLDERTRGTEDVDTDVTMHMRHLFVDALFLANHGLERITFQSDSIEAFSTCALIYRQYISLALPRLGFLRTAAKLCRSLHEIIG